MRALSFKQPSCGYVYATTGARYTNLARRAARNLRLVSPNVLIDLFTDQDLADPAFDKIHALRHTGLRPKMEALYRSRFDVSVVLDADTVVLCDIDEVFAYAQDFDIVAALGVSRPRRLVQGQAYLPRCHPYLNSGVMVARNSRRLRRFARAWEQDVIDFKIDNDQLSMRRIAHLYGISTGILGPEYNLIYLPMLDAWPVDFGAPRILHCRHLQQPPFADPDTPFALSECLDDARRKKVERLLAQDPGLGASKPSVRPPGHVTMGRLRRRLRSAWF